MLRILVVEDEPWIAMTLEDMINEVAPAVVITKASVKGAMEALVRGEFDFAFLDVDVTDGKTHEVARALKDLAVPFTFVSASRPADLPEALQAEAFIPKPFMMAAIQDALHKHALI